MSKLPLRQDRTSLYHRYSKASDLPLMALAFLMIPILVVPEVLNLSQEQMDLLDIVDWLIYGCFAVDFAVKLYLAPSVVEHIKHNWIDVVILALPLLRPIKLLQGARWLRLLRALRVLAFFIETLSKLRGILAGRGLNIVLLITLVVVVATTWLVSVFERDSGGSIRDFGDALWWAAATVTTVGYGDAIPLTPEGRGIAMFLMMIGIVFYSILTANIAAYFVESKEARHGADIEAKLDLILQRLDALETRGNGAAQPPLPNGNEHNAGVITSQAGGTQEIGYIIADQRTPD